MSPDTGAVNRCNHGTALCGSRFSGDRRPASPLRWLFAAEAAPTCRYGIALRAASSINAATSFGWDSYTEWLAPCTSMVWLCACLAYIRSRSGLMMRSAVATAYQLGLVFQAG